MKVLIIMQGFLPGKKYGGPPISIANFAKLLSKEVDTYIVTTNHDLGETVPYRGIESDIWYSNYNSQIKYFDDNSYNKHSVEEVIREIKPDIIYLQGLFQKSVIFSLELAKKYNIKVLLAPRGELCSGAFKKKYKKLPYIAYLHLRGLSKTIHYQSTSEEETLMISKYLRASQDRIHFLTNIPSIPDFEYKNRVKEKGKGKFVFISRIHPKKNLKFAISLLKDFKSPITFDIYGPLEDEVYWNECQQEISGASKNIKINYKGIINHDQIHELFNQYDCFLFPTLSENFGHVIAESLAVGCPVITSDQTPWNDLMEFDAGWSIPLSEVETFKKSLNKIVSLDDIEFQNKKQSVKNYFAKKMELAVLKNEYLTVLERW